MIRRITANHACFRSFEVKSGFNLVLGRRATTAGQRQSTNSIGKTTLLRIVHFLLGARLRPGQFPALPELAEWTFSAELELAGHRVTVTRGPQHEDQIDVQGAPAEWSRASLDAQLTLPGTITFSRAEWTSWLGRLLFQLPAEEVGAPSFRTLIHYFLRMEDGAFTSPFGVSKGDVWKSRVAEAFLFDLAWEVPAEEARIQQELQQAKHYFAMTERLEGRRQARVPELEAERARARVELEQVEAELRTFQVHERYQEIESEANGLTRELGELNEQSLADSRLRESYEAAMSAAVPDVDPQVVERMYGEAGVWFPERVTKRLEEVQRFHAQLRKNRSSFLQSELRRLETADQNRRKQIRALDGRRAELMTILQTHRALEHFARLQEAAAPLRNKLAELEQLLAGLERLNQVHTALKAREAALEERAYREHLERSSHRERATTHFSRLVQGAFDRGRGELLLDDASARYRFSAELPGIGGEGVSKLATACVDLTLARLWAERGLGPRLLMHDSRMFTGVDPRQAGAVLAAAFRESTELGYTYIATFNYDVYEAVRRYLPAECSTDLIRIELEDLDPSKRLLGLAFEEHAARTAKRRR